MTLTRRLQMMLGNMMSDNDYQDGFQDGANYDDGGGGDSE